MRRCGASGVFSPGAAYVDGPDRTFASRSDAALRLSHFCRSCNAQHFHQGNGWVAGLCGHSTKAPYPGFAAHFSSQSTCLA